jgi:hypothetical protein
VRRTLSFRARTSLIAEPGRGIAIASLGLMLLMMLLDTLGSLAALP